MLLKHSIKSIASRPPCLFWGSSWLATKVCQVTMVILIPLSTKELLHEGWGSPRPPHKDVDAAPHQAEGSLTLPARHQDSKDDRHIEYKLEQLSSTAHKAHNISLTLKPPITLTYKVCAKPKNLITKYLGWLGGLLQSVWDLPELQQLENSRGEALI